MIHALKTIQPFFNDIASGKKKFEIRRNDRPFKEGDYLALNEWDVKNNEYTGRVMLVGVSYILSDDTYCKEGTVTMTITPCRIKRPGDFDLHDISPSDEISIY